MGSQVDKKGQVLLKTVLSYLSLLRANHVDHTMPLQAFEGPQLSPLIKGGKRSFPHTKAVCLPLTREILVKITRHQPTDGNERNIDAVFKAV